MFEFHFLFPTNNGPINDQLQYTKYDWLAASWWTGPVTLITVLFDRRSSNIQSCMRLQGF